MVNAIAFETAETLVSHVTGAVSKVRGKPCWEERGKGERVDVWKDSTMLGFMEDT